MSLSDAKMFITSAWMMMKRIKSERLATLSESSNKNLGKNYGCKIEVFSAVAEYFRKSGHFPDGAFVLFHYASSVLPDQEFTGNPSSVRRRIRWTQRAVDYMCQSFNDD